MSSSVPEGRDHLPWEVSQPNPIRHQPEFRMNRQRATSRTELVSPDNVRYQLNRAVSADRLSRRPSSDDSPTEREIKLERELKKVALEAELQKIRQ